MAGELNCPSCGAAVPVRSAALPYVTCPYCHTLIRRGAQTAEAIGTVAELPFDVSPVQIGTSGRLERFGYVVVGRVRWGWSDGSWNEWLLECSDGKVRWLGEAMGSFMLTEEDSAILSDPVLQRFVAGDPIGPGLRLNLGKEEFVATDVKEAECLGSEGALPIPTAQGTKLYSVDFRSSEGRVLSLQRDEGGCTAWIGFACELAQMRPRELRRIDGWTMPADLK